MGSLLKSERLNRSLGREHEHGNRDDKENNPGTIAPGLYVDRFLRLAAHLNILAELPKIE